MYKYCCIGLGSLGPRLQVLYISLGNSVVAMHVGLGKLMVKILEDFMQPGTNHMHNSGGKNATSPGTVQFAL